ncbi:3,4-dihydroxy-2-butanone-4-phosphate synthase [Candidatus Peregrinibacteria bacterium]|nr:3,4-dihydroxy-2-butanone-4-phosphate synthase [Candidatus Peregrinibacteria bacterium]
MFKYNKIEDALADFKKGRIIIVVDDKSRENEGDLVCAGQKVTPDTINFMSKYGRGLICVPLEEKRAKKFKLPLMVASNTEKNSCRFTVSVDYKHGTTTGISAYDRAKTVKALVSDTTKYTDFCRPGHIFPIIVDSNGLNKRKGHSEAAIELCRISNFVKVAVICEILRDDGKMARNKDLYDFALRHNIKIIHINQLLNRIFQDVVVSDI